MSTTRYDTNPNGLIARLVRFMLGLANGYSLSLALALLGVVCILFIPCSLPAAMGLIVAGLLIAVTKVFANR